MNAEQKQHAASLREIGETLGACYGWLRELGHEEIAARALRALETLRCVEQVLRDARPIPEDLDLRSVLRIYGIRELAQDIDVHENTIRKVYEGEHRRRPWAILFKIAAAPGWTARGVAAPSVERLNELWEAQRYPHGKPKGKR